MTTDESRMTVGVEGNSYWIPHPGSGKGDTPRRSREAYPWALPAVQGRPQPLVCYHPRARPPQRLQRRTSETGAPY